MDNLIQELSAFMTPLPCFADESSRRAVLINAGLSDLLPSVNLTGTAYQCVASILHDFEQYGRTDALLQLLQEIRNMVGGEKRAECDALIDRLRYKERQSAANRIVPSADANTHAGSSPRITQTARDHNTRIGQARDVTIHQGDQFNSGGGNMNVAKDEGKAIQHNHYYSPGTTVFTQPDTIPLSPGMAPSVPHLFVGRDHDMDELRDRLSGKTATTLITTVRGWPGIGKTTLAAALAHDSELQKTFPDGVLWAALGTSPDVSVPLNQWLLALGDDPQHYQRTEEKRNRLSALLRQRKMLLIVDDVWQAADAQALLVGGQHCRTLLTTREPEVAQKLGLSAEAIYRLLELSETDAIELIRQLSPESVRQDPEGVRRLVQELEGLPLALKIAGSLLAAEAAMGWGVSDLLAELAEGTRLLEEQAPADRTDLSNQTTPTVAVLFSKSTDRLDDMTWERFVLLGLFASKPATFDIPAISVAWNLDDPRPTIRELVNRGLLEPTDGGRFQMHALLTVHAKSMWEAQV